MKAQVSKTISVVVADDEPLVLLGLATLFKAEGDIKLLAQATTGDEALRHIEEMKPDVAVVSLHLPGKSGLEVIAELQTMRTKTRAVILASNVSHEEFMQAIKLNVNGMLLKSMPLSLIARCVRMVHAGEEFIEKKMFLRAFGYLVQHSAAQKELTTVLTSREVAVVELAVKGLSNKNVARELTITEGTVKMHLHRIYEKLHVHGRIGLMQLVQKNDRV